MSGTNAGTGQPLTLKCSQCKKKHRVLSDGDWTAETGELVRTGQTKRRKQRGGARMNNYLTECRCLVCGHLGWYAHKDAARKPLEECLLCKTGDCPG